MIPCSPLKRNLVLVAAVATGALALLAGCKPKAGETTTGPKARTTIQVKGSDTMVNLAQVWAEEYQKLHPQVEIEVSGGGSGVGIAALTKGTIDLANASRDMKPEEKAATKNNTGKEPREYVVAYDALAVYVNKSNPLTEITNQQLAEIFAEGGKTTKWSEAGVQMPAGQDQIVRVSRQSSSGTYEFFREHVLGKKDFKLGSRDMNGSKEVVELVGSSVSAIGYSGLGYNDPAKVKMLRVSPKAGQPAIEPSVATTLSKQYPIARPLLVYTLGEPSGELKGYVDWLLGDAGQMIVEKSGYVPLPAAMRKR